jgi:hypothetical protein
MPYLGSGLTPDCVHTIAFPEPYLLTEYENTIIDDNKALLNKHGLTSHQSQDLLERLGRIIEMGQRVKGTTH